MTSRGLFQPQLLCGSGILVMYHSCNNHNSVDAISLGGGLQAGVSASGRIKP